MDLQAWIKEQLEEAQENAEHGGDSEQYYLGVRDTLQTILDTLQALK